MSIFLMDQVNCDAEIEVKTEKGTAKTKCDGVLLPITRLDPEERMLEIWKCSKCGREVK